MARLPRRLPSFSIGQKGIPDVAHFEDNEKFYFGDSDDSVLYWDGTEFKTNISGSWNITLTSGPTLHLETLTSGTGLKISVDSDILTTGKALDILGGTARDKSWLKVIKNSADTEGSQVIIDGDNVAGEQTKPSLRIGASENGFYPIDATAFGVTVGGAIRFYFTGAELRGSAGNGAVSIVNEVSTATNPVYCFRNDVDTGLGSAGADQASIIAGGVEMLRCIESATDQVVILPSSATTGIDAKPSLRFGSAETGFYTSSSGTIDCSLGGVRKYLWGSNYMGSSTNYGGVVMQGASSATVPALSFRSDQDSGIGRQAADCVSVIGNGAELLRAETIATLGATETSLWLYDLDNGAIQQVTVGAADSGGAGFKVLRIPN